MKPEEDALTRAIIGVALGVHRDLGPALAEGLYHQLLCARLRRAGLEHLSKPRVPLIHRGMVVDTMESDLVVPRHLIVELKVLTGAFAGEHFAQIFSYMKLWGIETGLLMDFGKQELFLRRVSYRAPAPAAALPGGPAPTVAPMGVRSTAGLVVAGIDEVMREHGLGYRDTTYRALLTAELRARGAECVVRPTVAVAVSDEALGETQLDCVLVNRCLVLKVLALNRSISAAARAATQACLRHLKCPFGMVVNFGKADLEIRAVTLGARLPDVPTS